MLNLNHVRAFVAVIDCGTFQNASRRLSCSQPTVSQHIAKLEAALQTALVVRDRQRCQATPEGEIFMPFALSLLRLAERAQRTLETRSLTIGASSNIGTYLLRPHIRSFRGALGPEIELEVWIGPNPQVLEKWSNNELDVAIMEWRNDRPGFTTTLWRHEALVVIVPPDHPWMRQRSIDRERLLDTPLIGGESGSGTGRVLREMLGEGADRLRVSLQLGSTEAVKHAVKAGLGVSIVLVNAVVDEVRAGSLRALTVEGMNLAKDIYISHRMQQAPSALAPRFTDHLLATQTV